MPDASTLGSLIRERRLEKGFSLGQLATKLGHTAASVRRWERGEDLPEPGLMDKIAEALDVEPARLHELRGKSTVALAAPAKTTEPAPEEVTSSDGDSADAPEEPEAAATGTDATVTEDDASTENSAPTDDAESEAGDEPASVIADAAEDPDREQKQPAPASERRVLPWEGPDDVASEPTTEHAPALPPPEVAPLPATSVLPAVPAAAAPVATPPQPGVPSDPGPTKVIPQSRPAALTDAPTEAVPVVAPPVKPQVAASATSPTDPTRVALERPVFQNPFQAMFDPDSKWLYWIRTGLLFLVSLVLLYTFIWALGELWDSLGELLDTVGSTEEVTDVESGIDGTTDNGTGTGSDN